MRIFNTSGACIPEKHYTLMREALIVQGEALVDQGRFLTIFAPRQTGKTTYFQLLFRHLSQTGYTPVRVSCESLQTIGRTKFYQTLGHRLAMGLLENDLRVHFKLKDQVVLVGVSTIAELVVSAASPFNIVDQLQIPYFTFAEVQALIGQFVSETGQPFDEPVIKAIYANTQGQPGLVNGLCQHLVEVMVPDRTQPVTMAAFYPTLKHFLTERYAKNILNIVQKAKLKQAFMLRILFNDAPIPFTVDNPNISFLYANGIVDNVNGMVEVPVPLYSKRLITALRPEANGETQEYTVSAYDTFSEYVSADGLNLPAILLRYGEYVQRRGFRAFDTEQLKESAWHYSLDGFINFFIQRLGGDTLVEVSSGRGRTDILILYQGHRYIIETKVFTDAFVFAHGKQQLADYLISEGLSEGFYVVFSQKHSADDPLFFDETIIGKRIRTYIIRTDFAPPSTRPLESAKPKPPAPRRKKARKP